MLYVLTVALSATAASLCTLVEDAHCINSGEHILGTRWPGRPNFALWCLTSMGPECLICFTSLRVPRILRWLLDFLELFSLVTKDLQNPAQKTQRNIPEDSNLQQ